MKVLTPYYMKDEFENEKAMTEFMDNVLSDFVNPDYHLYFEMHDASFCSLVI